MTIKSKYSVKVISVCLLAMFTVSACTSINNKPINTTQTATINNDETNNSHIDANAIRLNTLSEEPISMALHQIDTQSSLTLLSRFSKVDFIIDERINSDITINVENLPAKAILNGILFSQNLILDSQNNKLLITPVDTARLSTEFLKVTDFDELASYNTGNFNSSFNNVSIRTVLDLIAKYNDDFNIIVSDDVDDMGTVYMHTSIAGGISPYKFLERIATQHHLDVYQKDDLLVVKKKPTS